MGLIIRHYVPLYSGLSWLAVSWDKLAWRQMARDYFLFQSRFIHARWIALHIILATCIVILSVHGLATLDDFLRLHIIGSGIRYDR